jgi:hypothetical protein
MVLPTLARMYDARQQRGTEASEGADRVAGVKAAEARQARQEAAERYRPEPVDLLVVAEAPPGAQDRYFYFEDVMEQDSLFRYVARGVLGTEPTRRNRPSCLRVSSSEGST